MSVFQGQHLTSKRPKCKLPNALNLSAHSQSKQGEKVNEQNRPVHGNVGGASNGTKQSDGISLGGRVPEFELCSTSAPCTHA